jgi:Mn2+/Fe2+ NRAMP family transporter
MKKIVHIALGVITSIGGFLEVGSIATAVQGGAEFGYRLAWAVALGTLALLFLMEMSGRLAAVTQATLADHMRKRFGIRFFAVLLTVVLVVSFLVLASEIGGVSLALQMATGISFQYWALPVAFLCWLLIWVGTFGVVEQGTALLGLVAVAFAVGALKLHPQWTALGSGLLPSAPHHESSRYWFLAVSILGASISPYLYFFYSSGAIEDKWDTTYIMINRVTATLGNCFGGLLSVAVLVVAAIVFEPRAIQIDRYEQIAVMLTPPLGRWGFVFFLLTLGVTCFGAAVEITLASAYLLAQGFGWEWSENARPTRHARFSLSYTVVVFLAALPMALGVDPLKLTNFSMVLTAASLPVSVIPLLALMNDRDVLHRYGNGWISNVALGLIALLSIGLLIAALPLQLMGSG